MKMRFVELAEKFRIRFPGRDESFVEGVEIGLLLAHMATDVPRFSRRISVHAVDQARSAAAALDYHIVVEPAAGDQVVVNANKKGVRPALRLVRSARVFSGSE